MKSIRTSLVVGTVLVTTCAFALSSIAIYRSAKNTLVSNLDDELGEDVRLVASTVRTANGYLELDFEKLDFAEFTSDSGPAYLQLWFDNGDALYRSPGLAGADLDFTSSAESFVWTTTPQGKRVRAVGMRFQVQPDDDNDAQEHGTPIPASQHGPLYLRVVAAMEPSEVDTFLARLRTDLLTVGLLTLVAAAVLLTFVIRSSLRPLDVLASRIAVLDEDELSTRVQLPTIPAEIAGVVRQLNQLLSRLESAFQRERTLSADIAHELRTPVAGLRSTVEVALSRPRPLEDYRATLEDTLDPIRRVQSMIETLLYLGRLESGQIEIEHSTVDMRDVVTTAWKPLAPTAETRHLAVDWKIPHEVAVVTDPLLLEIAVRNVLENAVLYANEGGYLHIEAGVENSMATLRVVNSGSQVAREDAGDLVRRFARADISRQDGGEHVGLGLSIASKITSALHASLQVGSNLGGEFTVTFVMPEARERAVI